MPLLRQASVLAATCALGVLAFAPQMAQMQTREAINSFESVIEIQQEGSVSVNESIVYDFGDPEEDRHGIFREIPLVYTFEGKSYALGVDDITVTSESGAPTDVLLEREQTRLRIRIGDPVETVAGEQSYTVRYTLQNALGADGETLEFYWNVTGNGWNVPIERAEAVVIFPESVDAESVKFACYEGGEGSTDACTSSGADQGDGSLSRIVFVATDLAPREGLTAAVSFPREVVSEDYEQVPYQSELFLMLGVGAAAAALLGAFIFWFWLKYGKDPKGRGVIVRQYDPPKGLTPAEVGLVVDERIHDRDITAEIVHLAEKGYIHIFAFSEKQFFSKKVSYAVFKLKEPDAVLKEHERLILEKLFQDKYDKKPQEFISELPKKAKHDRAELQSLIKKSREFVLLEDLKESFHKDLSEIKKTLYTTLTDEGYFENNPNEIIGTFSIASVAALIILIILSAAGGGFAVIALIPLYAIASGYVLSLMKRTEKGVAAKEHALGLREYLSMAEKERFEFHFDPRKNPKLFEKLLPYAIALRVDRQWAEQFEGIYQEEPEWYTGGSRAAFSSTAFVSDLSGFTKAASAASSSSASSGGGFSGGGAGGGGGGSW